MNKKLIYLAAVCFLAATPALGVETLMSARGNVTLPTDPNPLPKYVTVTGSVFTLSPNVPLNMRPAYQDPTGLVWGHQTMIQMNSASGWAVWAREREDAEDACKGFGARLPTIEELIRLRESMSSTPNPASLDELLKNGRSDNKTYTISKPALPDLDFGFPENGAIWAGQSITHQQLDSVVAVTGAGFLMQTAPAWSTFRCVIDGAGDSESRSGSSAW